MLFDTFATIKYRAGASITNKAAHNPNTRRCEAKKLEGAMTEVTSQGNFKLPNEQQEQSAENLTDTRHVHNNKMEMG